MKKTCKDERASLFCPPNGDKVFIPGKHFQTSQYLRRKQNIAWEKALAVPLLLRRKYFSGTNTLAYSAGASMSLEKKFYAIVTWSWLSQVPSRTGWSTSASPWWSSGTLSAEIRSPKFRIVRRRIKDLYCKQSPKWNNEVSSDVYCQSMIIKHVNHEVFMGNQSR